MYNETGLPFVLMCSRFSVGQPPNCRISGEGAANARYPEKCMLELLPDPGLRFLRAQKTFLFDSVVLRLHAFFGMCARSRVPLSLYVCACVFACVLCCYFGHFRL